MKYPTAKSLKMKIPVVKNLLTKYARDKAIEEKSHSQNSSSETNEEPVKKSLKVKIQTILILNKKKVVWLKKIKT